ncbi:MAG: discoidin domain-containing protein [Gammaproteobacteria bacterium SHHR-1]|uniref:discoidin domain-containing protein n=1 Tax=Magnetovirga frankeli TaxID=947516 RepID=UPI0012935610|nr:discoidin domain-containing protein [gamma proteobacterium SS-5]
MRKRILERTTPEPRPTDNTNWLDLERLAQVEVSSEDADHPIEQALLGGTGTGWRAADPGPQSLRLIFDRPQRIGLIYLRFAEQGHRRTQEYQLRWSADRGSSYQEILRQQWNFDPEAASEEIERHQVDLPEVSVLELNINPDIGGAPRIASLAEWRMA